MAQKFLQIQPCRLAGGGCTATATSIILETFAYPDGTAITTADLGTTNWATIEPNTSREEIVSFTGVTQNVDGTATLTGVTRGLKFGTPYTADANLRKAHAGGVAFVVSNNPQLYENLISFDNDETVTGEFTFPAGGTASAPKSGTAYSAPTDDLEYTSKKFVVDVASGVGVSYNKIVVGGTGGEDIVAGQVVYLKTSDQEWYLADASTAATAENILYGIAQGAGSDGAAITGGVLIQGKDENQTGLTAGKQFLSDTAGSLSNTTGTVEVTMGIAENATTVIFKPLFDQQLTEDQQDALAGSSGTPSATNKYITADDVVEANTASKIPRRDSNGDVLVAATPTNANAATPKNYVDTLTALIPVVLDVNLTEVNSTTSGEKTVYTYTMPANTMGGNDFIEGVIGLSNLAILGSETFTILLKLGGTTLCTLQDVGTNAFSAPATVSFRIYNNNSTSAQVAALECNFEAISTSSYMPNSAYGTGTKDTTTELAIAITATTSAGNTQFTKKCAHTILNKKA